MWIFLYLATSLPEISFRTGIEAAKRGALILANNATNYFVNKKINLIKNLIKLIKNLQRLMVQE